MSKPTTGILVDGGGTVWRTTDGGNTWSNVFTTDNFQTASFEITDTVIYLVDGSPPRLWRSTDAGLTWQVIQIFNNLYRISQIAHLVNSPDIFWFVGHTSPSDTLAYIYYSPSGSFVDTIIASDGEINDFQPNPYNPNHTLISTFNGIYEATSPTGPWTLLTQPPFFGLFLPIDIEFTGNDTVVISSILNPGIFRGYKMFGNWVFSQVESREIGTFMNRAGTNTLYCGSFGKGVFKSTNNGISWQIKKNGLYAHNILGPGSATIVDSTIYFVNMGGTIYKSTNGGTTWDTLPKNFLILGSAIEVAPSNPNFLIVSALDIQIIGGNPSFGTIFRSTDGGVNWEKVDSTYQVNDFLITRNPDIILGVVDNVVIRSTSGGINFDTIHCASNSLSNLEGLDTIFAATTELGPTYVSYNQGADWDTLIPQGTSQLSYDGIRKFLYLNGYPIYKYNLNNGLLDSLQYYGISTTVSPNGKLYFLHFVPPDTIFIARSFDGGNVIEQEIFPIPYLYGGVKAGNGAVFYYDGARGLWVSKDITQSIFEKIHLTREKFFAPSFIKKGKTGNIVFKNKEKTIITISVHDIMGRIAKTIYQGEIIPGIHKFYFSTKGLTPGSYFLILNKHSKEQIRKKMIVY